MPLRSSKLKWAWQTQFLSHTLQILGKVILFEDLQMVLLLSLETFIITKVAKNVPKLSVHVQRSSWIDIRNLKVFLHSPSQNSLGDYFTPPLKNFVSSRMHLHQPSSPPFIHSCLPAYLLTQARRFFEYWQGP